MQTCKNENCKQTFITSDTSTDSMLGYCSHDCRVMDVGEPKMHSSKPAKAGKQIHDLTDLHYARVKKRSVIGLAHPCWDKSSPAAFMMNLSGHLLLRHFNRGLWIYEKK